jgi:hypothetical protein
MAKSVWELNEAQVKKAHAWVEARWAKKVPCPYCRASAWELQTTVACSGVYVPQARSSSQIPMIMLVCTNCAHICHLSAVAMDIIADQGSPR